MKQILILAMVICSCSPQQRLQRLIKKHPELISTQIITLHDTIVHNDTFVLKQKIDSFVIKTDTVIETKSFYITKYRDVLKIVSKPDTVILNDTIFYTKTIQAPYIETKQRDSLQHLFYAILFLLMVGFVGVFIFKWIEKHI